MEDALSNMKSTNNFNHGNELDIAEIAFLTITGLFFIFYFVNPQVKYFVDMFYLFIGYALKHYTVAIILYLFNLFLFLIGAHGLYIRFFEIRLTGSKLKMHNKLEKIKNNEN
jgi:hypothetical protein